MNYINARKNSKILYYFSFISIAIGLSVLWFKPLSSLMGLLFVFSGVSSYFLMVFKALNVLADGGEDRFIELYNHKDTHAKEEEEEYTALTSLYFIVKPISSRLPKEVAEFKFNKIIELDKKLSNNRDCK